MKAENLKRSLYSWTNAALHGSPRQRSIVLQEGVDKTIDAMASILQKAEPGELWGMLSSLDVDKVHPEFLDVMLAMLDGVGGEEVGEFEKKVLGRLEKVDEVLRPIALKTTDGHVITPDVRKEARELYRKRAKEFGKVLREEGSLDRFYRRKRSKETMDAEAATAGAEMELRHDGDGGFRLSKR